MSTVTAIGVMREAGGLKESLAKFRKHHEEVGSALLNLSGIGTATGEPVEVDEPRPEYVHQPWPTAMHHADGRVLECANKDEVNDAKKRGFRPQPYEKPRVAVHDVATEKKELLDQNRALQAQLTAQGDLLSKFAARLEELEGRQPDAPESEGKK